MQLKRVYAVREMARAQGFPDSYIFKTEQENATGIVRDVCLPVLFCFGYPDTETRGHSN